MGKPTLVPALLPWFVLWIMLPGVNGFRAHLRGSSTAIRDSSVEQTASKQHPQHFDPIAAKTEMEAQAAKRQHSKTCGKLTDAASCKAQKLSDGWSCEWQVDKKSNPGPFVPAKGDCQAVTVCSKQWPTLFHGELPEMWLRGIGGTIDCATRMSHGCTGVKWLHCFMALSLASCCWCCCCQPCFDSDRPPIPCPPCPDCSLKDNCVTRALKPKESGGVVNDTDSTDEYRDLGGFDLEAALKSLTIRISWKDQGFGTRGGRLRARLNRGETVVSEVDVFGLCGRKMDAYGNHVYDDPETVFGQDDEIVSRAQPGDTINFSYLVGAQDANHHELHIKFFEADPDYNRPA